MTHSLKRAIAAIRKQPRDVQDAIATRILLELEDEQAWQERFAATSDEQWDRMAGKARREIESSIPLDDFFSPKPDDS
ncbi:MAG: hypothetical protein D6696_11660 [Acidobacteria bacterium]|nr:MAG: hypothetical protein D6696_11660 [Acidobacteriota bacterium]